MEKVKEGDKMGIIKMKTWGNTKVFPRTATSVLASLNLTDLLNNKCSKILP